jgi:hypothetical protein
MDTNSLNVVSQIPLSISKYIQGLLRQPADFGASPSTLSHPSLGLSPTGAWMDPSQINSSEMTNYQGSRGDTAQSDMMNKMSLVDLLTKSAGQYSQLQNTIPFLNAKNIGSQGGIFGGLI